MTGLAPLRLRYTITPGATKLGHWQLLFNAHVQARGKKNGADDGT